MSIHDEVKYKVFEPTNDLLSLWVELFYEIVTWYWTEVTETVTKYKVRNTSTK